MTDRNTVFARALIAALAASGVEQACVSPGSRNTPLSVALADSPIEDWSHHDERSAAFFALGIAKRTGKPVAIVTTSGTAAAELHPAITEAAASRTPLIALTADRPAEMFDIAAPQMIDQRNLFGSAVRWSHDLDVPDPADTGPGRTSALGARLVFESLGLPPGPVHLNVRFREPLLIGNHPTDDLRTPVVTGWHPGGDPEAISHVAHAMSGRRGVIVAGPQTDRSQVSAVADVGRFLGWPVIADPISGLRAGAPDISAVVGGDLLAAGGWLQRATPEYILRVGAPPTSKQVRSWLAEHVEIPQIVITDGGWPDPMASAHLMLRGGVTAVIDAVRSVESAPSDWLDGWKRADAAAAAAARRAIDATEFPSEPGVVAALADGLAEGSMLWVASSMPIRNVDAFFPVSSRDVTIHANRGANGIDGLISTALGAASDRTPTVALAGDLSMLHDVGALATMSRLEIPLTIVVVNNNGGGIFHFLPQAGHGHFERHFGTPHDLSFSPIAASFGIAADVVDDPHALAAIVAATGEQPRLVEVTTDREESVAVRARIINEVNKALAKLS